MSVLILMTHIGGRVIESKHPIDLMTIFICIETDKRDIQICAKLIPDEKQITTEIEFVNPYSTSFAKHSRLKEERETFKKAIKNAKELYNAELEHYIANPTESNEASLAELHQLLMNVTIAYGSKSREPVQYEEVVQATTVVFTGKSIPVMVDEGVFCTFSVVPSESFPTIPSNGKTIVTVTTTTTQNECPYWTIPS